jgi:hypothetical protein
LKRAFDRLVRWSALSRHTQFIGTAKAGLSSGFLALLSLPLSCPSGQPTLVANLSSCQAPMPVASCIRALVIITPGQTKRRDPFRTVRAECSTDPATGRKKEVQKATLRRQEPSHLRRALPCRRRAAAALLHTQRSFTPHSAPSRSALLHARIPFVLLTRARALAPLALTMAGPPLDTLSPSTAHRASRFAVFRLE